MFRLSDASSQLTALLLAAGLLSGCSADVAPDASADLVLRGGKIATVDAENRIVEALASRDGRIVALGSNEEIERWIGSETRTVDLEGALAVPGFIEGHAHLTGLGQSLMNVELGSARTWDEVLERVADAVAKSEPGQWIVGRGWHQEKWNEAPARTVEGNPVHDRLSETAPANPVLLTHASGHAGIANARAMEVAGIDRSTPDPDGGTIVRDADGNPTGLLRETAEDLVYRLYDRSRDSMTPEQKRDEMRRAVRRAVDDCLAKGVTSFQDAGSDFETFELLREMADEGDLGLRVWMLLRVPNDILREKLPTAKVVDHGGHRLTLGGIKHSIDGALGSHGAWLLEPYTDMPDTAGLNTVDIPTIEASAEIALEHDIQLCVHAIGDRANRETLDIFERTLGDDPASKRWRVEHAQHLHPDDLPRFAELGVVASMQGVHCTSDAPWVPKRLGSDRAASGAYMWRSLIDSGAVVTNGTDAPVENVDPIPSFYASVTRNIGGRAFYPEQVMTREEALRSYTWNAAYAAFEEDDKGSLEVGKLADITVLDRDLLTVPEEQILGTRVLHTILDGEVVFSRE